MQHKFDKSTQSLSFEKITKKVKITSSGNIGDIPFDPQDPPTPSDEVNDGTLEQDEDVAGEVQLDGEINREPAYSDKNVAQDCGMNSKKEDKVEKKENVKQIYSYM